MRIQLSSSYLPPSPCRVHTHNISSSSGHSATLHIVSILSSPSIGLTEYSLNLKWVRPLPKIQIILLKYLFIPLDSERIIGSDHLLFNQHTDGSSFNKQFNVTFHSLENSLACAPESMSQPPQMSCCILGLHDRSKCSC